MFAKLLKLPKVLKFLTHKIDSKTKKDDFTVVFNFAQAEGTGLEVNCTRFLPLIYVPHTADNTLYDGILG